jgi:outer membrane immunogenic protein
MNSGLRSLDDRGQSKLTSRAVAGCRCAGRASHIKNAAAGCEPFAAAQRTSVRPNSDTTDATKIGDRYAVIAGRVGYVWDRVLVYGKGGVGFANISSSVTDICNTGACGTGLLSANITSNRAFWVAGGGVEHAFTTNWSVKAEYLFLGLSETYNACGPGQGTALGSPFCSSHNIAGIHTGKVGINYHF